MANKFLECELLPVSVQASDHGPLDDGALQATLHFSVDHRFSIGFKSGE